ncbi:hypothetical protein BDV59DRAFT_184101 [Aspergillus ambiguus]|uniref:uncharacterized protein n=1 Tax=Aspergillus ambiguus TaxID=176160 RepID=UPI003CCE06B3
MASETLSQLIRVHLRPAMEGTFKESGAGVMTNEGSPSMLNQSPCLNLPAAATPTVSDSTLGRGKRLTLDEQRALVRICAERMINPDPKTYNKSIWVVVSQKLLEKTNRSYSWQSCRRSITRLVFDRQMYWEAVDENRQPVQQMDALLAAEVDQWMGVCVRSHEQLKTPEAMLQSRLQKPPSRQLAYDAETEAQLRAKRERVLKWVSLLPDDVRSFVDELQPPTESSPPTPNLAEIPRRETFDQKLRRMMLQRPQYRSSDYSSGLDEEDPVPERSLQPTQKRLREDDGDEEMLPPPLKAICRPDPTKKPHQTDGLNRLNPLLVVDNKLTDGSSLQGPSQWASEIPLRTGALDSFTAARHYLAIMKVATDGMKKSYDGCMDILEREKRTTDDELDGFMSDVIKGWVTRVTQALNTVVGSITPSKQTYTTHTRTEPARPGL